jgi:hypothetical protein
MHYTQLINNWSKLHTVSGRLNAVVHKSTGVVEL